MQRNWFHSVSCGIKEIAHKIYRVNFWWLEEKIDKHHRTHGVFLVSHFLMFSLMPKILTCQVYSLVNWFDGIWIKIDHLVKISLIRKIVASFMEFGLPSSTLLHVYVIYGFLTLHTYFLSWYCLFIMLNKYTFNFDARIK